MMMMIKEKRDMKPFLVKFGVALALSFAGFLYSRIRKRIKPSDSPPSNSECDKKVDHEGRLRVNDDDHQDEIDDVETSDKPCIRVHVDSPSRHASPNGGKYRGDRDGYLLPEFQQVVKDFDDRKTELGSFTVNKKMPELLRTIERDDYEQEIESLKRRIKFLVERERKLEVQLLEYYGIKEQETLMRELQNRLKIHSMETKLFMLKIENLEAENKRLAAKVADYSKVVTELEAAKSKIRHLRRKIRDETEHNKEQIFGLTHRVVMLQEYEHEVTTSHSDAQSDVQRVTELEAEAEGLRKCNEYLQQENADLAQRLESTQILANSLFEDPERQELHQVMHQLREENEKMKTEVERLQADRCADAEELVYLRWINACLRYELRNYQPPPGKTVARDLSKCLSPTSEKKAKQLILEYAITEKGADRSPPDLLDVDFDRWASSNPSYLTDSTDQDEFSGPGSSYKPHSKKVKFFSALRKLVRGITSHHHHHNHNDNDNQSAQNIPMYSSRSVDDIGKRFYEARHYDSRSNPQSPRFPSSNHNSNNSSLEYKRLSSLAEEDENTKMNHSRSSSSPGGVRFVLARESMEGSSLLHYTPELMFHSGRKSDLTKYAEVLRDHNGLPKHKKSASYHAG